MYSAETGQARLGYRPSKKSIKRMVEQIHALTVNGHMARTQTGGQGEPQRLRGLGRTTSNSHRQQSISGTRHTTQRCGCRRGCSSTHTNRGFARAGPIPLSLFTCTLGLGTPGRLGQRLPWVKGVKFVESRMREICLSGCVSVKAGMFTGDKPAG